MKERTNISLDEDTKRLLKYLAADSHKTVSQWITDKAWEEWTNKHRVIFNPYNEREWSRYSKEV